MSMEALVTDALLRKSLAAVRSLGRSGYQVAASEATRFTAAGCSRYCHQRLVSPSPSESPEDYAAWLLNYVRKHPGVLLLPMDEASVLAVLTHAQELARHSLFLQPPLASFRLAANKYETVRIAQSLGLACPKTSRPATEEELLTAAAASEYPLVIKPLHSSGSRGIQIVADERALRTAYAAIMKEYGEPPMVQQYIPPGDRFDACVLMDEQGEAKATFVQREVRHYPMPIGPSTVQESVHAPELAEQAVLLLRKLNWRGIAEVEWMRDPRDGILKLMEINPRYWNSLYLAIQSGVDFPLLHARLAKGEQIVPVHSYRVGQFTRNLLPGDLLYALSERKARGLHPPLFGRKGLRIEDDIWSREDPMAAAGFALSCARYLFDRRMWKKLLRT